MPTQAAKKAKTTQHKGAIIFKGKELALVYLFSFALDGGIPNNSAKTQEIQDIIFKNVISESCKKTNTHVSTINEIDLLLLQCITVENKTIEELVELKTSPDTFWSRLWEIQGDNMPLANRPSLEFITKKCEEEANPKSDMWLERNPSM